MKLTIDKTTYMTDTRFAELRNSGISYEEFSAKQSYYMNKLGSTSIIDLYNKGKEMYEIYTKLYNEAGGLFAQLKNEKTQKCKTYNELIETYANQSETGTVTASQKNAAALKSGYTTDLINSVKDAEIQADIYLSQRFNAVDMQRRGLA